MNSQKKQSEEEDEEELKARAINNQLIAIEQQNKCFERDTRSESF